MALCLFAVGTDRAYAQVTSVSFGAPTLVLDRQCISGDASRFQSVVTTTVSGGANYFLYFLDGNNVVMQISSFSGALTNSGEIFSTSPSGNPTLVGPFRLVASNNGSFGSGSIFNGTEVATSLTFDANALDPDCPAAGAAPANTNVREQTNRSISNFMSRRADQITANDPDLWLRLNSSSTQGDVGPIAFSGSGTSSNSQMAFSTSLRQMANAGEASKVKRLGEVGTMMGLGANSSFQSKAPQSGFDIWVKGTWSHIDADVTENDMGLLYVGADYRIGSTFLIGVLAQFDWMDETNSLLTADIDGQGWLAGPYLVARLSENLIFEGRAAWGQSDNDITLPGISTGSFDTNRWLLKGQLTGDLTYNSWHIAPHVGVLYFEEQQKSFTDSTGIFIPGQDVSLGRLTFGPRFSTKYNVSSDAVLSPHIAIEGIWDFDSAEIVNVATGLTAGSDDFRGRVEAGMALHLEGGITLRGEGFYDGIGAEDYDAYGGSARLAVPLN